MNNFSSLKTLLPYLRLHKRQYVIGISSVIVSNLFALVPAYFIRLIIDGLTGQVDASHQTAGIAMSQVALFVLGILLTAAVAELFLLIMRRSMVVASRQIEYEIRRDLFAHLQELDKHYYDRARTGDLMNRLTGDLSAVRDMLGFGGWQIINITTSFVMSIVVMFDLSWSLALVVMGMIPVIVGALTYMARLIYQRHKLSQEQSSLIAAKAQENFSGARVVKGYAIEDREIADYRDMNKELLRRNIALTKVQGPIRSFAGLLMGVSFALILWFGGREVIASADTVAADGSGFTLGMLVQFITYVGNLAWPMMMLGWITGVVQRGVASWVRLQELYDARPKVSDVQAKNDITSLSGHLRFEGVGLEYGEQNQQKVLSDINLDVPAGMFLGITGPTGSGKTVLSQLMTRSIDPSYGVIRMDGHDLREIPLSVLRAHMSVVPQEPFLFSDTIANNIAFGLDNDQLPDIPTGTSVLEVPRPPELPQTPDLARVKTAAGLAGLADDIEHFPNQYDTLLGERGVTLSGGQRQRTAIARAIIREPHILILDDSLSAVDTETERKIIDGLRVVAKGRTVILIAHRISTLRHADQIVVLNQGRLVEQGHHDELVAQGGHYAELERLQRLAKDLDQDVPSAVR